jgi:hypothetical protein
MRYEPDAVIARIRAIGALPAVPTAARAAADELLGIGSDYARVAAALVLLGAGAADEAHNLVTPLSWHYSTIFGGEAIDDSPAKREATYAHALVHRSEANHAGEYGNGFFNSAFWFRALGAHELDRNVREAALAAADTAAAREHRLIQRWVDECLGGSSGSGGGDASTDSELPTWSPIALNVLLAAATATPDDALREFCEAVATAELRCVRDLCAARCGVVLLAEEEAGDGGAGAARPPPSARDAEEDGGDVDVGARRERLPRRSDARMRAADVADAADTATDVGLHAARLVSSAHAALFARAGAVVVRRALGAATPRARAEAAAALAARLLDAPAVWLRAEPLLAGGPVDSADGAWCAVLYADSLFSAASAAIADASSAAGSGSGAGADDERGGPVAVGGYELGSDDALVLDPRGAGLLEQGAGARVLWFATAPAADGEPAAWRDALHGLRGRTPTSVIEWSKGPPAAAEVWRTSGSQP